MMESQGTVAGLVSVVRRRWWLVALMVAITLGASSAYVVTRDSVYEARMKIVVGQGQGIFRPETGNVTEPFAHTMADLAESEVVARMVIDSLGLRMSPASLLSRLHVTARPQVAVLHVSYRDEDPARAERILGEVGSVFTSLVARVLSGPSSQGGSVTATVFDPAHAVPGAVWPRKNLILGVSGVLGVLLGLALVLLREQYDDRVRFVDSAEVAFGMPAAATLPSQLVGARPVLGRGRFRRRVDRARRDIAMQKLRAGLLWSLGSDAKVIVVTSAVEKEGKSSLAATLALALARDGRDVIAVDADLRRPVLHDYLGVAPASEPGFEAIVAGGVAPESVMVDVPIGSPHGRLRGILASPRRAGPSRELQLADVGVAFRALSDRASFVIVDTPPLLMVTDGYPLVAAADLVVAAVRVGKTTERSIRAMCRLLDRLHPAHVELVLTDVDLQEGYYSPNVHPHEAGPATPAESPRPLRAPRVH